MGYTMEWERAEIKNARFKCPQCGGKSIEYRVWESSCGGYDDLNYRCVDCGKEWWVESSDA